MRDFTLGLLAGVVVTAVIWLSVSSEPPGYRQAVAHCRTLGGEEHRILESGQIQCIHVLRTCWDGRAWTSDCDGDDTPDVSSGERRWIKPVTAEMVCWDAAKNDWTKDACTQYSDGDKVGISEKVR